MVGVLLRLEKTAEAVKRVSWASGLVCKIKEVLLMKVRCSVEERLVGGEVRHKSKAADKILVELVPRVVHDAAVAVLLVVPIYVKHETELLHGRAQVNRLLLAATELEPDEVALTEGPVVVKSVPGLLSCKRPRINPQLNYLLAKVVEQQVAQVFQLFVDIALPFQIFVLRLRQDVELNEVLVTSKEPKSFEELCPRSQLLLLYSCSSSVASIRQTI